MLLKKILFLALTTTTLFANRDNEGAIDVIKYMFETKYAPLYFKETTLGWNLKNSITALKGAISFTKNPQWLLRKFFLQPCDYHTSVIFLSTGSASLPFSIKKINHSIYVSWVSPEFTELSPGDEILFWDGFPAIDIFNQFKLSEISGHVEMHSTDAIVEHCLTQRYGDYGYTIPRGEVVLSVLSKDSLEMKQVVTSWRTSSEYFPFKALMPSAKASFQLEQPPEEMQNALLNKKSFFPLTAKKNPEGEKSFALGSKRGYLPILGPVVQEFKKAPFFYYIYTSPSGHKVAYLRLGDFDFDRAELSHLKKAINFFEKNTDGLILDLTHNPGGFVMNMFALISYFLEFPFRNYEQNEILTTEEVELAVTLKVNLEDLLDDEQELVKFVRKECPYNPSVTLATQFLNYAEFLLESWKNGERITPLYPLMGVDIIHPDPSCHYSKPLLVLTDNLSVSCSDFFPAMMREAGRAHVFGQRTAGAGGTVTKPIEFPNQLGIRMIVLTSSIIYKPDGDWIENKGTEPDYLYEITPEDLKYDFSNYSQVLNETMDQLIEDIAPVRS